MTRTSEGLPQASLVKRNAELETAIEGLESRCVALAAELKAVEAIHNEAVFIADEHYELCPPVVQKVIRSLAVLQIPAYNAFMAEIRTRAIKTALNDCTEYLDRDCIMDSNGISYEDAALREAGAMALHNALLRKGSAE